MDSDSDSLSSSALSQVPLDLQIAVEQLRNLPIFNNVDVQIESPSEQQNPCQDIENTSQRLNQNNSDAFENIEAMLQTLNQPDISAPNSSNEPQNEQRISQSQSLQEGEGLDREYVPDPEEQIESASYDRFNTLVMRRRLTLHRKGNVANIATFYQNVMGVIRGLASEVESQASRDDAIQLEVVGENVRDCVSVTNNAQGSNILPAFEGLLDRIVQSNNNIAADEGVELIVHIVRNPRGGGKRKLEKTLDCEILKKKKRHLYIVDDREDQLCFAISLSHVFQPDFTDSQCDSLGKELQHQAGLDDQTPVTFGDIHRFEEILKRKIVVFYRTSHNEPLSHFATDFADCSKPLFLFLMQNHYYGIKNLKAFIGAKLVCNYCYKGLSKPYVHSCKSYCQVCMDPICPTQEFKLMKCSDCQRMCRSLSCFARHKEVKPCAMNKQAFSLCDQVKQCKQCNLCYYVNMTTGKAAHRCSTAKCRMCGEALPTGSENLDDKHLCYIQPIVGETKDIGLVFYDFETFVNEKNEHIPFLVHVKTLKGEERVFYGLDCVRRFLLHFRKNRYRRNVFIAHNARGFDSYLVLKGILKEKTTPQNMLMTGCKILSFEEPDYELRFIDSLSFLPMRLSAMPKALGFTDQTKGYFPHRFSSEKHLTYKGPYPPPSDYGVERMTKSEQEEFYKWYGETSQGVFDFKKKALYYCKNDVVILQTGCVKFREQFLSETGVDPFSAITIASACMKVFLTNYLQPKTLAIPSPDNYTEQCKRFSNESIKWLEWVMHNEKVFIRHALNGGEAQFGRYFVDGYAEIDGVKYAWEFHGCFYHGCPECFNPTERCPLRGLPFGELHAKSDERERALQSEHNLRVIVMREHTWSKMKKSANVVNFLQHFNFPEPLVPRNALYGGRTSALKLRHTTGVDESVYYVDVCSLYPYVMSTQKFPLGHPTIIYKDFGDPRNYFGLIRATVCPPRGLFFPVLPYKCSTGKLNFPLCRTCTETNNQTATCSHDDEDRALTGVWVTNEFNKALELGYRVVKITEVWHFEQTSDTVFVNYIHSFLKGKQEASGYPPDAMDQETREKYIRDYHTNQGIQLDAGKIQTNSVKRQVAKLCLNSLWGKFAQRDNLLHTNIISESEEFFSYLFSGTHKVEYFNVLDNERALIRWRYTDRCIRPPGKQNNIFIAAFTTAHARLKLYSYLEQLKERILYIDTDSLIYVVKNGETPLELGNYLGDLTDELDGDTIQEFVATGPKSYAYQTKNKKKVAMRVKGITQTQECCELINFDSIKDLVEGYLSDSRERVIEIPQHSISRNKKDFVLKNTSFQKKFKVVYDKRRLFADGATLPFGY